MPFWASTRLISVFTDKVLAHLGLQLSVIGVNRGAQGSFGRASLAKPFEDSLQITHAVGVVDVLNRSQGLFIGDGCLYAGELQKTAFQGVERDLALCPEEVSQKLPMGNLLRLNCLGNALVEPLRTTSARKLADERMGKLVLQHPRQLRRDRTQAVNGNAQLSVIDSATPGGRLGDIKKGLLGVEHDRNAVAGSDAEFTYQIVVFRLEGCHQLAAQRIRRLLAFILQGEVAALVLRVVGLGGCVALRFLQVFPQRSIGAELERMFPGSDGFRSTVGGKLDVSQNRERIGRV